MTCREFIEFLYEFLDGELPASERTVFEDHLDICPACVVYLRTYRQTIELSRRAYEEPTPPLPEDLVHAILTARPRLQPSSK